MYLNNKDGLKEFVGASRTRIFWQMSKKKKNMLSMSDQETISLTVAVAGLVLVAVSSIPAVCDLTKRLRLPSRTKRASSSINGTGRIGSNGGGEYAILKELYQDDDGYATEESSKKFSDRFHRIFISILSTTGFLLSLALGIIATVVSPGLPSSSLPSCPWLIERWLQFGIWVCSSP